MRRSLALVALVLVGTLVGVGNATAAITTFRVDSYTLASKDKTQVTVAGTIMCTAGDEVWVNTGLSETVGRIPRGGTGFVDLICTGDLQSFTATIDSSVKLLPGPVATTGTAYDVNDYAYVSISGVGKLSP